MTELTQEELKQLLHYDPDTGEFRWLQQRGRIASGSLAGTPDFKGYLQIKINYRLYRAHRLAWLYIHGEWPKNDIDHINGDGSDNRISNLRDVPRALNMRNARKNRNNTSGHNGITWCRRDEKWHVQAKLRDRVRFLGKFGDIQDAVQARQQFNEQHDFTERHGI